MVLNCPECDAPFGYVKKVFRIYSWKILHWINIRLLKTYPSNRDCARCRDCGRTVHDFIMPTKIWNHVIADINPDSYPDGIVPSEGAGGVWCYDCFCERAHKKGYIDVFKCELAHPYDSSR